MAGALPGPAPAPPAKRPHPLPALCSALLPGAGQLLLGQIGPGLGFLALWALWLAAFYPLRIPRGYWGWTLLVLAGIALTEAATFRALRARSEGMRRVATPLLFGLLLLALGSAAVWQDAAMHWAGFRFAYASSGSMDKTISEGDRLVADGRAYRRARPQRMDIVLLPARGEVGQYALRRVLGVPGDTLAGRDGQVWRNGRPLREPYVTTPGVIIPAIYNFAPVTVPPGEVFVLGDNRDGRLEARAQWFGLVEDQAVLGKALYVFSSVNDREGDLRVPDGNS
jgi:signal peptidase I